MDYDRRNEAKRFIILIDTFYDNAVKLVASAAAEPDALYLTRLRRSFEAQEFKRTASRLIEMRSQAYLALPHGRRDSPRAGRPRGSWRPEWRRRDRSSARCAACVLMRDIDSHGLNASAERVNHPGTASPPSRKARIFPTWRVPRLH